MYYQPLTNFPRDVLVEQYQRPATTENFGKNWNVKLEWFTQEINDLFATCNLKLKDAEIFRKPPSTIGAVHSDIIWDQNVNFWAPWNCALNINLDNTDSEMYWYAVSDTPVFPNEDHPMFVREKLNGIHYGARHSNKFKNNSNYSLLASLRLTEPTLLKTNVPHSVENLDNKDRWCLSLRFINNPTYEECVDKLREFI